MTQPPDQFSRLLSEARNQEASNRARWIEALTVSADLKSRLLRAMDEGPTLDVRVSRASTPIGLAPDAPAVTRGASLSGSLQSPSEVRGAASAARNSMDPMLGKTFAGVVIERVLGSGGMGRVYLGTDGPGGPLVALKVLLRTQRDDNVRRRFEREARLLQTLRHRSIASVLRTGVEEDGDIDIPYIVMEYVEGVLSITDYVFRQRLGVRDAAQLFLQVCEAVGHAHSHGYIHRDLKPANILVNRQGAVKVIDFGVARAVAMDSAAVTVRTETGQIVGTMQYMSPEQFKADPRLVDKRSDVYALAAVLYELVSGIQPHDLRGLPVHEAARIVCETDPLDVRQCNAHIDATLAALLNDGLSREAARRPDDAIAFARRLQGWLSVPAPTIEPTIHLDHPDKVFGRQGGSAKLSSHGLPQTGTRQHATRPKRPAKAGRGGWGGVVVITGLVVVGALVAFDVVPVRKLIARVREFTSPSTAAAANSPAVPVPTGATKLEQIRVVTSPEGAAIRVNGEPRGLAPALVLTELAKHGSLEIEATMDGWQPAKVQWTESQDPPLVVFNLVPNEKLESLQRVFVLDVAGLPHGSVLTLLEPVRMDLKLGAGTVTVNFVRQGAQWRPVPLKFDARTAAGKPLELDVGAKHGKGTVAYDVVPDDAHTKVRIRVD